MSSPWGKIQNVTKYINGVSFVSTAGHGGYRVTPKILAKYAIDDESLIKMGGLVQGNYIYFEEDCAAQLFLFDCPEILKIVAFKMGLDENVLFEQCKESVKIWFPSYFEAPF